MEPRPSRCSPTAKSSAEPLLSQLTDVIVHVQEREEASSRRKEQLDEREIALDARERELDKLTRQIAARLSSTIIQDLALLRTTSRTASQDAARSFSSQDTQAEAEQRKAVIEQCDAADQLVRALKDKSQQLSDLTEALTISHWERENSATLALDAGAVELPALGRSKSCDARDKSGISMRSSFLRPLHDIIGKPPIRPWENEWTELNILQYKIDGLDQFATPEYVRSDGKLANWKKGREGRIKDMVATGWKHNDAEAYMCLSSRAAAMSKQLQSNENPHKFAASIYSLSNAIFSSAQKQLKKRQDEHAEFKRTMSGRIVLTSESHQKEIAQQKSGTLPPMLYWHRSGSYGLDTITKAWKTMEDYDMNGFRGLTSTMMVKGASECANFPREREGSSEEVPEGVPSARDHAQRQTYLEMTWLDVACKIQLAQCPVVKKFIDMARKTCAPDQLSVREKASLVMLSWFHFSGSISVVPRLVSRISAFRMLYHSRSTVQGWCKGYTMREQYADKSCKWVLHDSDVIGFESQFMDQTGMHAAVITENKIKEAGEWVGPGNLFVDQRLLVMTATYRAPLTGLEAKDLGKMIGHAVTLEYASKDAYIRGLGASFYNHEGTLEDEMSRASIRWVDWKGVQYDLCSCWGYVKGTARHAPGCTPGVRDAKNDGLAPEDFLVKVFTPASHRCCAECVMQVNDYIMERRKSHDFCGSLPKTHCNLTLEEVLAVRMYSGPAYQPINTFLRQISKVQGEYRELLVSDPTVTFAATAIRKLADLNTEEDLKKPLYRAVRGTLPNSFWASDDHNLVSAVDTAFMSTSQVREASIGYMAATKDNVLWRLAPKKQSDSAFHCGASIKILSQFENEDEVLFPPCTMLNLEPKHDIEGSELGRFNQKSHSGQDEAAAAWRNKRMARFEVSNGSSKQGDVEYLELVAIPSFV